MFLFHKGLSKPSSSLSRTMPGKSYIFEPAMVLGQALKQCRDEKYTNPGSISCSGSSSKHLLSWQPAGRMHQEMHWEMHQVSASPVVPGDHSKTSIRAVEEHPPAVLPSDQVHSPGWSAVGCFIRVRNAEGISSRYAWWLVLLCHWIGIEETKADFSKMELEEGMSSSLPWEAIFPMSCENRNFQSYCSKPWKFHPCYNLFSFSHPSKNKAKRYYLCITLWSRFLSWHQSAWLHQCHGLRPTHTSSGICSHISYLGFQQASLAEDEEGSTKVQTTCLSDIPSQQTNPYHRTTRIGNTAETAQQKTSSSAAHTQL